MVKLKDVGKIITGNTPKTSEKENYESNDICFIKPSDIEDDSITYIEETENFIAEFAREKARILPVNSVLVTCIGIIGKIGINKIECAFNQQINAIVPNEEICLAQYLAYAIKSKKILLQNMANAPVVPILNKTQFADVEIKIVDLKEQECIVEKLSQIEKVIIRRKQQLQKLDELVKARFVEMFGDLKSGTCHCSVLKLKDLSYKISDGVHAKPNYTDNGKPFLSVVNINKRKVDFTDCKYVSEEDYAKMIKSTHPQKGDVLYTKVGATYGIPAYIDTEEDFCLYVSVCLIKPIHEKINSRFLAIQMDMPFVKHQADSRIKGIGVPDLHLNQIREFDIICPERKLQNQFVDFVEQIDKSKLSVQKSLEKLETLNKALMQKYFG